MAHHARQTKGMGADGQAWGCLCTSTSATSDDIANAGMIGMMGHGAGMMLTVLLASTVFVFVKALHASRISALKIEKEAHHVSNESLKMNGADLKEEILKS